MSGASSSSSVGGGCSGGGGGGGGGGGEGFEDACLQNKPEPVTIARKKLMFKCEGNVVFESFQIPNSANVLAMFTFKEGGYNRFKKRVALSMNFAALRNLIFAAIPLMDLVFESYLTSMEGVAARLFNIETPLLLESGYEGGVSSGDDDTDDQDDDDDDDDEKSVNNDNRGGN